MFPKSVEVTLQSEIFNNFRCKMACDSLDIDIEKKSVHHLKVDLSNIPDEWSIGVIYGASGSGKTTLAQQLLGSDCFKSLIDDEQPIINQLPKEMNYEQCSNVLTGIGLNSVPCWVRPVKTLSNGQRARAEAALLMTSTDSITIIDEFTSVVDRTVAKAMSQCIQKFARRKTKQIVIITCHNDIIDWVKPDWMIDCNKQECVLPDENGFFLHQKSNSLSQSGKLAGSHGDILASITI